MTMPSFPETIRAFALPLLAGLLLAACSDDSGTSPAHSGGPGDEPLAQCVAPPFLKPGDRIALLSPSYSTPDSNIRKTAAVLEKWGYATVVGRNVGKLDAGKYAGTAEERASDLVDALRDTSVKAILCNRGGYGAIQLVDLVDTALARKNPKWIVGFSDVTTLHAMQTRSGVMSVHGTMSSFIANSGGDDPGSRVLRDLLAGKVPAYEVPAHPLNVQGRAEGILVGGNMATFAPLLGTRADLLSSDGIILFMEEIGENLRNIDRMYNSLLLRGVMERVRGVVLGEFEDSGTDLDWASAEEMLVEYLKDLGVPVLCGFPAGHGDVNLPLVMGSKATIDVGKDGATLEFDVAGATPKTVKTDELAAGTALPAPVRVLLSGKVLSGEE